MLWAKREMAVNHAYWGKAGYRSEQSYERRIPDQLVPRTDPETAFLRQAKQALGFLASFDEWFLDVHVSPRQQGAASRLEVGAGRGADVHDVRPCFVEQVVE
jgi:hypothetical protein